MIESLQNEKIKNYSKLNEKKYREEIGLFIAAGEHLVREALKTECVKEILLLSGEKNTYGEVTYVTENILKKVSSLTNAPKVLAVCYKLKEDEIIGNTIILDDINDPGNLGTIIRSAVAFNYNNIVLSPSTVDLYNSKVIRASEGMIFSVNIVVKEIAKIVEELKKKDYYIYGTNVSDGELPDSVEPCAHALIIGNEARGINKNVAEMCDKNLYIKMNPACESLNAGVSASILMYELNK